MLAKLSCLALFVTYISALGITASDSGIAGDFTSVDFIISAGDPTHVDLLLFDVDSALRNYTVSEDMEVNQQNTVIIPADVRPGTYQFVAAEVGDDFEEYARSNDITIS
ncbi:hypothetical protein HD554DRAFT_2102662 [Boletus coccyginus]|nr:hypothetical protein HD554DRAFT_2102662 [Boletus coccyginus]